MSTAAYSLYATAYHLYVICCGLYRTPPYLHSLLNSIQF